MTERKRFELNAEGVKAVNRNRSASPRPTGGEIVRESHNGACWAVKLDGRKSEIHLSKNFVTVIDHDVERVEP